MVFAPSKARQRAKIWSKCQEPPGSYEALSQDLKDMDALCTLKNKDLASSKAPNQDLKDMEVLCTFKIKTESQNFDHGCIKDN